MAYFGIHKNRMFAIASHFSPLSRKIRGKWTTVTLYNVLLYSNKYPNHVLEYIVGMFVIYLLMKNRDMNLNINYV